MDFLKNKPIILFCLCGGALSIVASYYSSSPILLAFSSVCFLLSIIIWKFGYFLGPIIGSAANLRLKFSDYELVPSQDVLIKKSSDGYYAAMFMSIQLRESSQYKSEGQKAMLMEMFERAISSFNYTVKLSLLISNLELSDYSDKIIERRSLSEHRLSQAKPNSQEAAQINREIQSYSSQLKRLTRGEKPMGVVAYAQTVAFGLAREEVLARVRSQARECSAVLSNSLSSQVQILSGDELLRCFEWERMHPTTKAEIEDELF